ncbi:cytochrome b/b6 domain-containing protein [Methylomicrobium sp. RS1]|jgi:cytochrome b|uniref:cytochrome b/b6 domain-containing protein n=1 Tax=Candidatus Methylomicrobium oryzae TaxID=2802053 RepID=UPI001923C536|nr:cytochrome b/b6 domain-containing protein [Methylomicrobium sp. RS1]MBL1265066.1 cytochrome b/b6 domain-containing protein [Methylomicrobium sp. RS1]
MKNGKRTVKVWDPLVRIGHWTLVIAFFTAYLTEDDFLAQHVWAGYIVSAYVLVRLVWGVIGSRYARFRSFLYSPAKVFGYLKNLLAGKPQHYIGHNPAGGTMVAALLICLAGTAVTGMKLYAVEENAGPFAVAAQLMPTHSFSLVENANAEDDDENKVHKDLNFGHKVDKQAEEFWEEWHETFANLTLALVFLHILGVIVSSVIDKEKLVKAMLSGKKEIDDTYR